MHEVMADLVLCTLSLLVKFVAFTANVLASTQPVHYQQVYSTIGVIFIEGFVSMKIQRIIWKPHVVSRGYQRVCSGQTIKKEHEKIIKVQMMFQLAQVNWLKLLNHHYSSDIFKKKTTTNNHLKENVFM